MDIKSFILASFLSLSKAEKKMLLDTMESDVTGKREHTNEINKQELKLISEERFYEILDGADEVILNKYKHILEERRKNRGIQDGYEIEQMFHNKNVLIEDFSPGAHSKNHYSLQTDTNLYEMAEYMHVKKYNDTVKILEFYIPKINMSFATSKTLNPTRAIFEHNNKIWEYEIVNRIDTLIEGYHQIVRYAAVCTKDGTSLIKRKDELGVRRVLTSDDFIKPSGWEQWEWK